MVQGADIDSKTAIICPLFHKREIVNLQSFNILGGNCNLFVVVKFYIPLMFAIKINLLFLMNLLFFYFLFKRHLKK